MTESNTTAPEPNESEGFSDEEIAFIQAHLQDNPSQLILNAGRFKGLDVKKLASQIQSRQKAVRKLPEWSANRNLIFPPALSVEQCSSEATAKYKASLVTGETLVDMTGGMGVDCYYMGLKFEKAHYFEQQEEVARTAAFNFRQLKADNIRVHTGDSLKEFHSTGIQADWIYADPARRGSNQEKVVRLADCTPDIVTNLPLLFQYTQNIMIKTSPLLDIDLAATELQNLKEVYAIGYEQECKELLFILDREWRSPAFTVRARIIDSNGEPVHRLDFERESERSAPVRYSAPRAYLYEPHAAVLKAGAFRTLCNTFKVDKVAIHSQLYTSDIQVKDFPGRNFKIVAICKPDSKEIMKHIEGNKANLTVRNFPAKTEDLRKKWKLKEGGDYYLFATTLADHSKVVIVTVKPV
ncbi:THUMP-like domain-containing protein [Dyadobacter sp. MSC1_007]|jgi:hypothetical protein|uniref:THUMP-like domain-containing protein n=1 Tax=Dyadobacter sp. MSC1_007 TaxID=2909264 RepID=UPI00202E30BE|nr:hypothetical protein [Dyadobacter sp. MSC1_007]